MTNIVHKNIEIKNRLDNVTLIGDSLTVGLEPYFVSLVPNATINGKIGRQASEGFSILKDPILYDMADLLYELFLIISAFILSKGFEFRETPSIESSNLEALS